MVSAGTSTSGALDVSEWSDIVQVSAGHNFSVGVKSDGSVVATDVKNSYSSDYNSILDQVKGWDNISQISAGAFNVIGLKRDGSVVEAHRNSGNVKYDISGWTNIIQVSAGFHHIVALSSEGTVYATGDNVMSQSDVKNFNKK